MFLTNLISKIEQAIITNTLKRTSLKRKILLTALRKSDSNRQEGATDALIK